MEMGACDYGFYYSLQKLTKLYISKIVRLRRVLIRILISHLVFERSSLSWEEHLPLAEFAYSNSFQLNIQMAPYEALYDCQCRTTLCWTELGERKMLGPDLDQLRVTSDQQKSYIDLGRKDIEISIGDQVFLKVSSWKKVLRFGQKGKLSLRFIGSSGSIK
ncbi:reverse transcriptase [Gossypium australe]|uniref:Reverse transcriptase n=1 Tax=Gossypium australe TaxID=47621 RepID=A0A5B6X0Q5_9ROSI|nr:reverse transcriptase [Gossypium australe]